MAVAAVAGWAARVWAVAAAGVRGQEAGWASPSEAAARAAAGGALAAAAPMRQQQRRRAASAPPKWHLRLWLPSLP